MPCYLTADFHVDLPGASIDLILIQVCYLFDGATMVTTDAIARSIGCDTLAVDNTLRLAAYHGRICEVRGRDWVPLAN